jgi:hypothetical protein
VNQYAQRFSSPLGDDDQGAIRVEIPSPFAGVAKSLRDAYRLPQLPDDIRRLLARLR